MGAWKLTYFGTTALIKLPRINVYLNMAHSQFQLTEKRQPVELTLETYM